MKTRTLLLAITVAFVITSQAEIKVTTERNQRDDATPQFKFKNIPSPLKGDAAKQAKFTVVTGEQDPNGGALAKLHDGKLASEADQPSENFFFNANTEGGRLLVDLGSAIEIKQVNTYSWHADTRAPQVYKLYASDGASADFNSEPKKETDPKTCGWTVVATVDTRPERNPMGGQYGVSISDSSGAIGKYRYLLFDISRTEQSDPFGNTFYSEIDVIDRNAPEIAESAEKPQTIRKSFASADGKYHFTIDSSAAPDLTEFGEQKLAPVVREWYPKLVDLLPSDGFVASTNVTITFKDGMGRIPAATGRGNISCNAGWFRSNLKGEAVGAVVHELVHVVQAYGYGRVRSNPNATRTPNWIVEGIPDYLRWFLYEPQTHGAEITKRNVERAKYDASYRVTGNFLNWVTEKYDKQIVQKLNAAAREGKYSTNLWQTHTGKTVEDLGAEWKKFHEVRLAALAEKTATDASSSGGGWKTLFNGKDLAGWHNFRTNTVKPGWQVKDGSLACVDPHNAGDLCTDDQFEWFELQLDYNISEGGNSGIMFHVTDQGRSAWATGPEFQLEDNAKAADPQRCGWLYALYQPPIDPKTEKLLDATKPAGEWNHVRLLISPEKCEHEINGVKYFDYVLGSDDFKARVAKSKFAQMPLFAKPNKGYITLQGDHGQVSFRNIKVRVLNKE